MADIRLRGSTNSCEKELSHNKAGVSLSAALNLVIPQLINQLD